MITIAFLADALDTFKIEKDSTYAMMQEAQARGIPIFAFEYTSLYLEAGQVSATMKHIELGDYGNTWYRVLKEDKCILAEVSAIIVRKDPPFDQNYLNTTFLLDLAVQNGARVFNNPKALRDYNEKLSLGRFLQFVVPTLVAAEKAAIEAFHHTHQDVILKPLDAMGGSGIFHIGPDGLNLSSAIEVLTVSGTRHIMVQKFIPEIALGDKRVLLINGQVVPYALARIPKAGETRGNLAAGAIGVAQPLSLRDLEIAQFLAPKLAEAGLFLVGLDIIGDWLTEVNVTSPTCFQEITQQTGFSVAKMFLDELLEVLNENVSSLK